MNEKLEQKIIEYGEKYRGNIAKIMIQLGIEGYSAPNRQKIRTCLSLANKDKGYDSTGGTVQRKVGRKSKQGDLYDLC